MQVFLTCSAPVDCGECVSFNERDVYTIPLNMHQGRGDQTKHTLLWESNFLLFKGNCTPSISPWLFFLLFFFFGKKNKNCWGMQGERLVFGRAGHTVESGPLSSYTLAVRIKHFFHAWNSVVYIRVALHRSQN